MRTTLHIDDELMRAARELTGIGTKTAVVEHGLRLIIERESARRLALLRGSAPEAEAPGRRGDLDT